MGSWKQLLLAAMLLTSGAPGLASLSWAADPAEESYRQGEALRRDQIARQLDLNQRMIWSSGFGPRFPNPF
jgi:hypothetical protein